MDEESAKIYAKIFRKDEVYDVEDKVSGYRGLLMKMTEEQVREAIELMHAESGEEQPCSPS